ncbi:MAG: Ldh family oxidoreductase [Rhizobiaceae bacterium]
MALYPTAETDRRVAAQTLESVVRRIFQACGMDEEDAALLAASLVHSDRRGIHSHGVIRVPEYVRKLTVGGVDPKGKPRLVSQASAALVVDGGNSMGQIGGYFAMRKAIEAARVHSVALAALGGSNHCGALDWYSLQAAEAGMIGICGTNALPTMAPVGGIDKIVGINPVSVAMPGDRSGGFVFDFAFGATAHGKIRVYAQKGSPIPEGWAFDSRGNPTIDPRKAMDGLIQPIGSHKGIALGMAVGLMSSLLSGSAYGTELGNMTDGAKAGMDGQFFMAIDIAAFTPLETFRHRLDSVIDEMRNSRRREGVDRIFVPGDIERDIERYYAENGILLSAETVNDVAATAGALNVDASPLLETS